MADDIAVTVSVNKAILNSLQDLEDVKNAVIDPKNTG